MSGFKEVRKRGGNVPATAVKYPSQHQTLLEMGFDSAQITAALDKSSGNLETATALLLGEPAPAPIVSPKQVVAPMKVVGKQSSTTKTVVKQDIKEVHNKFMQTYKVNKCKEKGHHDKRMCTFYHSDGDRRRNPFVLLYSCVECPNTTENSKCPDGDSCLKAHNMLERMFHPELFKISYCQRGLNGQTCDRGNVCAFAHNEEDHRVPMSQTLPKQQPPASSSTAQSEATAQSFSGSSGPDPMHVSKAMTDSRQLDGIQEKLIRIIRGAGAQGIISAELPKRYLDMYNERLEMADEAGEKFRIKDLLLAHPAVHVKMHKGVQPRYVYEETALATAATTSAKPSVPASNSTPTVPGTPLSYAALAAGNKPARASPAPVTDTTTPAPAPEPEPVATKSGRRRGPSESDASAAPITAVAPAAVDAASAFGFAASMDYSVPSPVAAAAPPASGGRRRGPDTTPVVADVITASVSASAEELVALRQQIATLQSALDAKSLEVLRLQDSDEEVRKRDSIIAQLRQEKTAELNQFRSNIGMIETALIETQRQESVYINELPLHDTINKSSRARDELTKFVSAIKMQLASRAALDSASSVNVSKSTLNSFLLSNGINGNLSSVSSPLPEVANASISVATVSSSVVASAPEPVNHGHLMCSLPGCGLEGSFICSACGKAGYCGADHQREHWACHINECSI